MSALILGIIGSLYTQRETDERAIGRIRLNPPVFECMDTSLYSYHLPARTV